MPHNCGYCGKEFDTHSSVVRHERIHTNERPFACRFCGKGFKESGNAVKHERICQPIPTLLDASSHIKNEKTVGGAPNKNYTCQTCGKTFGKRRTLREHKRKYHSLADQAYKAQTEVCECGLRLGKTCMEIHKPKCPVRLHKRQQEKKSHRSKEKVKSKFPCDKCRSSYKTFSLLWDHKRRVHGALAKLHPKSTARSRQELRNPSRKKQNAHKSKNRKHSKTVGTTLTQRHAESDVENETQRCEVCGNNVKTKSFFEHKRYHALSRLNAKYLASYGSYNGQIYLCRYLTCSLAFASLKKLEEHELIHTSSKPYMCGVCDAVYRSRRRHERHLAQCASLPLVSYPCAYCGKFFGKMSSLWRHYVSHRPGNPLRGGYTCGHCGKVFSVRLELNKHNADAHQHLIPRAKDVVFQCKFCFESFASKKELLDHTRVYHWSEIAQTSTKEPEPSGEVKLASPKKKHGKKGGKFSCKYCGKTFERPSRLTSHERIHTNDKPHVCHICGMGFTAKRMLKSHQQNWCKIDEQNAATAESNSDDSSDVAREKGRDVDDEVIYISSSPSPSPPPVPPPQQNPALESSQAQRVSALQVISLPVQSAVCKFDGGQGAIVVSTAEAPSYSGDQAYLIQYEQRNEGPLSMGVPNELTRTAVRVLPTGSQNDPAVPVPMKLERVL